MKIIPYGKNIYVILDKVEEKTTEGGILLPDMHSEETREGTIIAVGDRVNAERKKEEKLIEVGQRILVQFYAGVSIHSVTKNILDDTHRLITESNVMALIEE